MEESIEKPKRKGIHKHFHVSKKDTYFYAALSISFFALVVFKVLNRFFELGMSTRYITWIDALQIAILWGILGFVSNSYYINYEKKYD